MNFIPFYSFEKHAGFLGILGAMDCDLIPIFTPSEAEGAFFCRKKFRGLNCQLVVATTHEILSILAFPGSYTDISIWNNCFLKRYLKALRRDPSISTRKGKYYIIGGTHFLSLFEFKQKIYICFLLK